MTLDHVPLAMLQVLWMALEDTVRVIESIMRRSCLYSSGTFVTQKVRDARLPSVEWRSLTMTMSRSLGTS